MVVLASGTANDQLSSFTVTISSLTLTSKSGATVNVLATPISEEFIHLNGHVEPIATVSIPQGTMFRRAQLSGSPILFAMGRPPG